jgi:hypothetical protein
MDFTDRTQHEQDLASAIAAVLATYRQQIEAGREVPLSDLERDLLVVLRLQLRGTFIAAALQLAGAAGSNSLDSAELEDLENHADQYADEQASVVAHDFTERVRDEIAAEHLREATSRRSVLQLADLLLPNWRAEAIAVTETTRAASNGMNLIAAALVTGSLLVAAAVGTGILTNRFWNTSSDDRVCPICEPLNGQEAMVWAARFPSGPPAHPNCRCYVTYGGLP